MSKMGKNVLKLPGAVAAEPEDEEGETMESGEVCHGSLKSLKLH